MANIVISWHNQLLFANENARPPFYQAFIDGLKKAGNNILLYENSTFMKNEKNKIPEKYLAQIKKFNPDLFIFFNNQFWDISDTFKDTPMVIYDVDSPNVFNNVDLLKENPNRYLYLTIQTGNREILHDILGCDLKRTQYIPPFTNIQREKCKQDINIAFCGSPWLFNDYNDFMKFANRKPCRQDRKYALMVFEEFKKNPQMSPVEIYSKLNIVPKKHYLEFKNQQITAARIAGSRRCKILSEIYDLGLEIRGYCWDGKILKAFPELQLCYNIEPVYDTKTTQEFFNSSLIGINTKHLQAKSGFSWRVCDILASNACLVTEKAPDIKTLGFNVPEYETISEARELCIKILQNENMRKDIVEQSGELIEKNHRIEHVIPIIEDFLNMKLHNDTEGKISIHQINGSGLDYFPYIDTNKMSLKQKLYYNLSKHFYKKVEPQEEK